MSFIGVQMAKHLGIASRSSDETDRGVTVRPSSTANFFVDSLDKVSGTSGDFLINKNQALFNGFFHRIAVNEVVVDWGVPNVAQYWGNNFLTVGVDGGGINADIYTVTFGDGFYTAVELLNQLVTKLNTLTAPITNWSIGQTNGATLSLGASDPFVIVWEQSSLDPTIPAGSAPNYVPGTALARALFSSSQLYTGLTPILTTNPLFANTQTIASPLILGTRYIDIVSPQLTYNQNLKDNTTATVQRDVLYRWYFAWDTNTGTDVFVAPPVTLFPYFVLQGYKPFNQRRILPYPKQIRWDPTQPVGQVGFQVYDDRGRLIDTTKYTPSANFQFQMSCLFSEN